MNVSRSVIYYSHQFIKIIETSMNATLFNEFGPQMFHSLTSFG